MADIPQEFALTFEARHVPTLTVGSYVATSSLAVSAASGKVSETFESSLDLFVGGPRFFLLPNEIHAVFPPKDSLGEHDNVLPHIELTRSTIPWERKAVATDGEVPWLALLLLQDDEAHDAGKVTTAQVEWKALRDRLGLAPEPSDEPDADGKPFPPVRVLQFKKAFLESIMPTAAELKWLTHVRMAQHPAHAESDGRAERAVLLCNRLPRPGSRATVHLVSLEDRFAATGFNWPADDTEKIELLSLYSWQFACPDTEEFKVSDRNVARLADPDLQTKLKSAFPAGAAREALHRGKQEFVATLTAKNLFQGLDDEHRKTRLAALLEACHVQTETFKGLMDSLDVGLFKVAPAAGAPGASFFELGSVPLAHGLRRGGKTVSWYRGPLTAAADVGSAVALDLPVRSADKLLRFESNANMLDVSYAAAWELGRLLSLSEPSVSQKIAQWKTSHAREVAVAEQKLVFSHVPFTDSSFAHASGGELEKSLQSYFEDLALLKGLPFQYLVPDERLLPLESLRVFRIDPYWVEALLDGAFSIGRVTTLDHKREKQPGHVPPHHNQRTERSGILLRSDLVSGWPSLMVEASDHLVDDNEVSPARLPVLRFERLGPDVLLVIFDGLLRSVDIHLPPEALHFGFSRPTHEDESYYKELKSLTDATETGDRQDALLRTAYKTRRVLDVAKFAGEVKKKFPRADFGSGHLAIELLEGVPRLRVSVKPQEPV